MSFTVIAKGPFDDPAYLTVLEYSWWRPVVAGTLIVVDSAMVWASSRGRRLF